LAAYGPTGDGAKVFAGYNGQLGLKANIKPTNNKTQGTTNNELTEEKPETD
jgi:hypothetical protein